MHAISANANESSKDLTDGSVEMVAKLSIQMILNFENYQNSFKNF